MCGRFSLAKPMACIARHFKSQDHLDRQARYNIAPTQEVITLRLDRHARRRLHMVRWGLVPSWSRYPFARSGPPQINARAETLLEKPSFKDAYQKRRCLIPADSFFEWRLYEDGTKQPYRLGLSSENDPDFKLFAFAGLWERFQGLPKPGYDHLRFDSCAIITKDADPSIQHIHHRMPVILSPEDYKLWLDRETPIDALQDILHRPPPVTLTSYPITPTVNHVVCDNASIFAPAGPDDQGTALPQRQQTPKTLQMELFG